MLLGYFLSSIPYVQHRTPMLVVIEADNSSEVWSLMAKKRENKKECEALVSHSSDKHLPHLRVRQNSIKLDAKCSFTSVPITSFLAFNRDNYKLHNKTYVKKDDTCFRIHRQNF